MLSVRVAAALARTLPRRAAFVSNLSLLRVYYKVLDILNLELWGSVCQRLGVACAAAILHPGGLLLLRYIYKSYNYIADFLEITCLS